MLVADAVNVLDEFQPLRIELAVEPLGDALDIERALQPIGDFGDGDVPFGIEFADVHNHCGELAEEQIAGLALDVEMIARMSFATFAIYPVPETLSAVRIEKDE